MVRLVATLLTALAIAIAVAPAACATTIAEYPLPPGAAGSAAISVAGDGGVWTALSGGIFDDLKPGAGRLLRLDRASGNWDSVEIRATASATFGTFADGKILFTMGPFGRFLGVLDPISRPTREIADVGQAGYAGVRGDAVWIVGGRFGVVSTTEPFILYRITEDGQRFSFPLPDAGLSPRDLAAAPDGSVWTIESQSRFTPTGPAPPQLAHTLPDGSRTVLPLNLGPNGVNSVDMTVGPDGVVWIAASKGIDGVNAAILRFDPRNGMTQSFVVPRRGAVGPMVVDGEGRLWYIHCGQPFIVRFDPATATEFAYATPDPRGFPNRLTVGGDGALWYTNLASGGKQNPPTIGRVSLDGESLQVDGSVAISEGVRTGVTCVAACSASAGLTVGAVSVGSGAQAAGAKRRIVKLGRGSTRLARAGTGSIVIKLSPAARKRLRAQRTVRAQLTVTRREGSRTRVTRSRVNLLVRKPKIRRSTG